MNRVLVCAQRTRLVILYTFQFEMIDLQNIAESPKSMTTTITLKLSLMDVSYLHSYNYRHITHSLTLPLDRFYLKSIIGIYLQELFKQAKGEIKSLKNWLFLPCIYCIMC